MSSARNAAIATAAGLALLVALLAWNPAAPTADPGKGMLMVYCAAGVRPPIDEIARVYEEKYGVEIRITPGNSGGLLTNIETHPVGDLYIPADVSYVTMAREKKLVAESIPLGRFRLVIATKPGNPKKIRGLDDLLKVRYVMCNQNAGVGKKTKKMLSKAGRWEAVRKAAKVFKPTVTEAAMDIQTSGDLDAGIIWDSTARQYGLDVIEVPEFAGSVATINVSVLNVSTQPAAALRFARFLAAPETGGPAFKKYHYETLGGDAWAETPELVLYAGGVNRQAVKETVQEFESREGCRISTVYGGCGTLVGQIKSGETPDTFLTCEAKYMTMVGDRFGAAEDVSRTSMVLLVQAGNPKNIRSLSDLTKPGMSVGVADAQMTALGALTESLMKQEKLFDRIRPNIKVTAPTAHELTMQLTAHQKLDAVVVYLANCQNVGDAAEIISITHDNAWATQNVAPSRTTRYPQLADRLIEALTSARSGERFRSSGFEWLRGGSR